MKFISVFKKSFLLKKKTASLPIMHPLWQDAETANSTPVKEFLLDNLSERELEILFLLLPTFKGSIFSLMEAAIFLNQNSFQPTI